jgi:hypothetical protein
MEFLSCITYKQEIMLDNNNIKWIKWFGKN